MPTVNLPNRVAILASGPDSETLLQNIITPDLSALCDDEARPGALLTPQGKILFDFVISRVESDTFRLDCEREVAADFIKRLTLYRLRAKVEFSLSDHEIAVSWDGDPSLSRGAVADMRFPAEIAVRRHYGKVPAADATKEQWDQLRIRHGIAEGGADFAPGDAFPHDVLFDQNGGVGLTKGCYVGQEVVSRMHHRGTARRRLVIVEGETSLPATGTNLTAGGKALGLLGTTSERDGLAIVRIDRVADAQSEGTPVLAGEVPVSLSVPAYAHFSLSGLDGKAERA